MYYYTADDDKTFAANAAAKDEYKKGYEDGKKEAQARIEQLEEQVMCMKIQMHGDCGVCKHRTGLSTELGNMTFRCYECMAKEKRPHWEYEGLPEVKSK